MGVANVHTWAASTVTPQFPEWTLPSYRAVSIAKRRAFNGRGLPAPRMHHVRLLDDGVPYFSGKFHFPMHERSSTEK